MLMFYTLQVMNAFALKIKTKLHFPQFSICCCNLRGLFQTDKIGNIAKCEQTFLFKIIKDS